MVSLVVEVVGDFEEAVIMFLNRVSQTCGYVGRRVEVLLPYDRLPGGPPEVYLPVPHVLVEACDRPSGVPD